jgi:ATP-dependent Lon protease
LRRSRPAAGRFGALIAAHPLLFPASSLISTQSLVEVFFVSEENLTTDIQETNDTGIPVLPLRDVVVYPHMVIPLFVGRERSIVALDRAMNAGKRILLVAQKTADLDDPQPEDLYDVGTLATILQLLKLPDGTVKVLVEGGERASIENIAVGDHFAADITILDEDDRHDEREIDVLVRSIIAQFEQYVKLNKKVPPEILTSLSGIDEPGRLADTVAAHMSLKLSEKQRILEIQDIKTRLEQILGIIEGEIDVLQIEKRIRGRVKQQMEKSQREYYLNEQMKAIQKELGEMEKKPRRRRPRSSTSSSSCRRCRPKLPWCATTSIGC